MGYVTCVAMVKGCEFGVPTRRGRVYFFIVKKELTCASEAELQKCFLASLKSCELDPPPYKLEDFLLEADHPDVLHWHAVNKQAPHMESKTAWRSLHKDFMKKHKLPRYKKPAHHNDASMSERMSQCLYADECKHPEGAHESAAESWTERTLDLSQSIHRVPTASPALL